MPNALTHRPLSSAARRVALLAVLCAPAVALAHPGHEHGGFWSGFLHVFHGIDHVLVAVAVGAWAARLGGRALWAVPLAFVAAMAAGAGLGAAGIHVPMVEPMIAVSVLLLGSLIALDARFTAALGALLVAVFAPFHGAAHVAGLPVSAGLLTHVAGLLAATALVHAAGIGSALASRARPAALRLAAAPIALAGLWLVVARAL